MDPEMFSGKSESGSSEETQTYLVGPWRGGSTWCGSQGAAVIAGGGGAAWRVCGRGWPLAERRGGGCGASRRRRRRCGRTEPRALARVERMREREGAVVASVL